MLPYLVNYYGNPHSRTHAYGWESEAAMECARQVSTEDSRKFWCQRFQWPVGGFSFFFFSICGWRWKWFGALSARDSKDRPLESLWRHSISFHISWLTDLCYFVIWLLEASVSSHWKWRLRGVQWIEFWAFAPGGLDLISVQGTKIQQTVWHVQKKMEIVVVPTP